MVNDHAGGDYDQDQEDPFLYRYPKDLFTHHFPAYLHTSLSVLAVRCHRIYFLSR